MEILALRAHGAGFRGCLIAEDNYQIFQYSPRRGFKILKAYPKKDFQDAFHFIAVMQKFMSPSAFIIPPISIQSLTVEELRRAEAARKT